MKGIGAEGYALLRSISWAYTEIVYDCHRQMGRYQNEVYLAAHVAWAVF